MANLIITMISIALAVTVATMGAMYLNPIAFKAREYRHFTESGFARLQTAFDLHIMYKGIKLTTSTADADTNGVEDWKDAVSSLKGGGISGTLMPDDMTKEGYVWSYGNDVGKYYFCFSGQYTKAAMQGFTSMRDFEKNKTADTDNYIYINSSCGAELDDLTIASGALAVTYWVTQ